MKGAGPGQTPLDGEILVYRGAGEMRRGWVTVVAAGLLTLGLFVMLPFSELVSSPPAPNLTLRVADTVAVAVRPPPAPVRLRTAAESDRNPTRPPRPKPAFEQPETERPRTPHLAVELDFQPPRVLDLPVDLTLRPLRPAVVAPPAPAVAALPSPTAYKLDELDSAPQPVVQAQPLYPYGARARNVEGFVELLFTVTATGAVEDIDVLAAEPGAVFADSAKRAVARWRFVPGTKDGRAVPARMQIRLRFELR